MSFKGTVSNIKDSVNISSKADGTVFGYEIF